MKADGLLPVLPSQPIGDAHRTSTHLPPPAFATDSEDGASSADDEDDGMEVEAIESLASLPNFKSKSSVSLFSKQQKKRLSLAILAETALPSGELCSPKFTRINDSVSCDLTDCDTDASTSSRGQTPRAVDVKRHSKKLRESAQRIQVYLSHGGPHSAYVLDPESKFCRIWHMLTSIVVIYIVGVISFDLGFGWWKISVVMYVINYLVDAYCWVDIIITFRTGFVHGGHLITDPKKIARHYLEFWFWIDVLACIPWEIFLAVSKSNRKAVKFVKWLKLPRLLRLGRLRKVMKSHARYMNLCMVLISMCLSIHLGACAWVYFVDPCAPMVDLSPFADWFYNSDVDDDRVMEHPQLGWECVQSNILPIYIQAAHTSVCMLLGVDRNTFGGFISGGGHSEAFQQEVQEYAHRLRDAHANIQHDPVATQMRALKLLLLEGRYPLSLAATASVNSGLTCAGTPGLDPKASTSTYGMSVAFWMDAFGTLMMVSGLFLQGMLFASITKLVLFRNAAEHTFRQMEDEVKRELDIYGRLLPMQVQRRIRQHFEFRWMYQAYGPMQLMNPELLSSSLRAEIALHLYKDAVLNVDFLEHAPIDIVRMVCMNFRREYYMQRDAIYRRGDSPRGLYILEEGCVWVTEHDSYEDVRKTSRRMEIVPGEAFGIGVLIAAVQKNGRRRVASRRSAFAGIVSTVLWLPVDTFKSICHAHPWFFNDLMQIDTEQEEKSRMLCGAADSRVDNSDNSRMDASQDSEDGHHSPQSAPSLPSPLLFEKPEYKSDNQYPRHTVVSFMSGISPRHTVASTKTAMTTITKSSRLDNKRKVPAVLDAELEERIEKIGAQVNSNMEKLVSISGILEELMQLAQRSECNEDITYLEEIHSQARTTRTSATQLNVGMDDLD